MATQQDKPATTSPTADAALVVCASCGRTEHEDRLEAARWSATRRNGQITVALCDVCLDALLDAE